MTNTASSGFDARTTSTAIAAVLVFVGAFYVRGLEGRAPLTAGDRPRAPDEIAAPMQLLGVSGYLRAGELTPRVRDSLREEWIDVQKFTARVASCPKTAEWLATPPGQRFERLIDELRRGSREEALAALHLVFELARRTEWAPGLLGRTQHADRIATLLQEWLRAWAERSADDALLGEPATSAVLLYGSLMRKVSQPLVIGGDDGALERAKAFLGGLLVDTRGQPTRFAAAVRAREPRALDVFGGKRDVLGGFADACQRAMPELDGDCGK